MAKNEERRINRRSYFHALNMNNFISRFKRTRCAGIFSAATLALVLAGCKRDEVQVYKVSKETPALKQTDMAASGAPARPQLQWTAPEGWEQLPAGDLRVASFKVKGKEGKDADVSVVPLAGMAGGDLNNVNRWRRDQLGLSPVTEEERAKLAEKVSVGDSDADLYDLAGTNPGSGEKQRILATVLHRGDTAWFFKMVGDDELVASQKKNFAEFLKSVKFLGAEGVASLPANHPAVSDKSPLPTDHPPIGGAMPTMQAQETTAGKPEWKIPTPWKEEPPTTMLLAKFSATDGDARAEITVSSFPGDVGGLVMNVNRWRRQVGLESLDDAAATAAVKDISVQSETGKLLDVEGTDSRTSKPARLIGVALPHGDQTWFFKMLGDSKVVAAQKDDFTKFVQSVKF
jgi:hypothetical protein